MTPDNIFELLQNAALVPLECRAFLRITGTDATRWLNGMVTNSVQALAPGEGSYSFLLNAQGRIQGDCTIYREPDPDAPAFLLETARDQVATLQQHLDRFIIMDDVELLPVMDDQHALLLTGERAADRLTSLSLPVPANTPPATLGAARAMFSGQPVLVLAAPATLAPAFELWAAPATIAALRIALEASAVVPLASETLEHLRILSGLPRFGVDIRDKDLPQETAQDARALHFNKGCYLGQEIVERIRSRGQVHRTFSAFTLTGTPVTLPAALTTSDGKPAGELTSAVAGFGLGYARREFLSAPLHFEGGSATASPARVSPASSTTKTKES
jgi:folate-binding protein YgfZ